MLIVAATLATTLAPQAAAQVSDLHIGLIDNGGIADDFVDLAGTRTFDLSIDFDGSLIGQQLLVELTSGSMIHHPLGNDGPPAPAIVSGLPAVEFDTFVTLGGFTADESLPVPFFGSALNLPGAPPEIEFSPARLSATWATAPPPAPSSETDFPVARITLSDDAEGVLHYLGSTQGSEPSIFSMSIFDGFVGFPPIPVDGDLTGDGRVDNDDLNVLLSSWGETSIGPGFCAIGMPGGCNGDPPIDNGELNALLGNWGFGTGATAIPEPATLAVCLIALASAASNRGRP